ncbi:uncharacterized protein CDV56_108025 [Aspergillus thermomutatus]|uniref:Major facilitator superfamily (MFS) profile domain-containing protein n=1 Tax=Aspergillus thermomutatus TaxID=41047 RepID=A0A397HWF9_ASPTH|nr:uncharacterized protein CDV56_108025 [Aspergillus thermomutatus]RHZ67147.1 hypothetical protein CDV56_108025 [Aspergillus thermomutatus]
MLSHTVGGITQTEHLSQMDMEEAAIIDWDGPYDPARPINWSKQKKWRNIFSIAFLTFLTPLTSSIVAPAVHLMMETFHSTNKELGSFVVSIYLVGFAIGPLVLAPLSEIYGRLRVYQISTAVFIIWNVACALAPNLGALLVFRLCAGISGSPSGQPQAEHDSSDRPAVETPCVVFGYLYLLFTTIPAVYRDVILLRLTARNNGTSEPEFRLPPLIPGSLLLPIGFFWYGWSADKHLHWMMPVVGIGWIGCGMTATILPIQAYLIDAYREYAASAIAAITVFRSLVGAFLPLAGPAMYASLGLGWGNSVLGFIGLGLLPVPAIFYLYGKAIRTSPRFRVSL